MAHPVTVESNAEWITAVFNEETNEIEIVAENNDDADPREGTITISMGDYSDEITITQKGFLLEVAEDRFNITDGSEKTANIDVEHSRTVEVSCEEDWITATFDETNNLLMQANYHYSLQDVKEPNLYREIYDYSHVPKVAFNMRHVPMQMPDEIWMTDTTFRDGQQSVSPFTPEQILHLFKLMSRLGGPKGMVRQSEFFLYTENDQKALHLCQDAGLKFPEITTWIRANEKDFELVKQAGVKETGVLVSCSDYHIFNKMHLTRKQAMDKYLGIVKSALDFGIRPRCHFEDITRADFYGFVVPFAGALMELSRESGIPIKIRACDTMGYGVSYPGTALPRSVQGIIYGLRHYAEVPAELLEWHGHNDFYKVVSNAATAWLHGCSSINCSLLGIGERTGNSAASWASASARATARWKPWPSNTRASGATTAAWT